jgi:hypothetical protein
LSSTYADAQFHDIPRKLWLADDEGKIAGEKPIRNRFGQLIRTFEVQSNQSASLQLGILWETFGPALRVRST